MDTRDRLLQAATRLFSELGFAAASTDAIVRAAKVNKRMLYHYFGDKDGLVREVLIAQWQAFAVSLAEAGQGATSTRALDAFFDFAVARPEFLRLVMWDGLAGGTVSRAIWRDARQPLFEHALRLLGGPRASAKKRDALKQKLITLLGATAFYFAYAPSLTDAFGADPLSPASLRRRRAHLHELLLALRV
jgi:TetR/AcrR family transcriptional regulator